MCHTNVDNGYCHTIVVESFQCILVDAPHLIGIGAVALIRPKPTTHIYSDLLSLLEGVKFHAPHLVLLPS